MTDKNEKTVPQVSVGADTEQPSQKCTANIIVAENGKFKGLEKIKISSALETVSMTDLYDNVYMSKPPLIDGLLYPGTYIFGGASKIGKSFLMSQFAYHISTGTPIWDLPTRKGCVLYLALEDDYSRLQGRMYRMFGTDSTDNLFFSVSASQLGKGLDEQLQGFVTEHPDTKLIIIDTLQKVREVGGDNYSYANDYEIISRLKHLTDNNDMCILLVHHTRKQNADDKFDMISGTTALLGAADGGFIFQKEKRTSNTAVLEVSGRDQAEQKIYLVRNSETLRWDLERIETELWKAPPEPLLEKAAAFITADNAEWCGSPTELVEVLGVDMKANALSMKLNINAGRLLNEYGICYENKRCHDGRKVRLHLAEA